MPSIRKQKAILTEHASRASSRQDIEDMRLRLMDAGGAMEAAYLADGLFREAKIFKHALDQMLNHGNDSCLKQLFHVKEDIGFPVTFEEYVKSEYFLDGESGEGPVSLWPKNIEEGIKMAPDVWIGEAPINEVIFEGGTGTGKTEIAKTLMSYYLYQFLCFESAQRMYGCGAHKTLFLYMFSRSERQASKDIYRPLRGIVENSQFFRKHTKWDKELGSALHFIPDNIYVGTLTADPANTLGQDVPCAIMDEANFYRVIQNSAQITGQGGGVGGMYDQAAQMHEELRSRVKSRFLTRGYKIGALITISSVAYDNDFTDRLVKEAKTHNKIRTPDNPKGTIYRYAKKGFEVYPGTDRYSEKMIPLLVGTERYATRLLDEGEKPPEGAHIEWVPENMSEDFILNPERSVRDKLGIRRHALTPFIERRDKIVDAMRRGSLSGLKPWAGTEIQRLDEKKRPVVINGEIQTDIAMDVILGKSYLSEEGMPFFFTDELPKDLHLPRYLHVDLSKNKDRVGIAVVKIRGWENKSVGEGLTRPMPHFAVELAMSLQPSKEHPVNTIKIVEWIVRMAKQCKFPIASVTYDSYDKGQSSLQLSQYGIPSSEVSMDRNNNAYEHLRQALYEDRLDIVQSDLLLTELSQLELDKTRGKVDHPRHGTKDVSDAVAGALWSASRARQHRGLSVVTTTEGKTVDVQATNENGVRERRRSGRRPFGR